MRLIFTLSVIFVYVSAYGQTVTQPIEYSPDKQFHLLITVTELPDIIYDWKYWLISQDKDSLLLTTAMTHDNFPPVTFWSRSSKQLIYEDRTPSETHYAKIKIYSLSDRKVQFETIGFIWGRGTYNLEQDHGLLFFLRNAGASWGTFDILTLDIKTTEVKKLSSVVTSADPITGAPEVESIDTTERKLTLIYETPDWKSGKVKIDY